MRSPLVLLPLLASGVVFVQILAPSFALTACSGCDVSGQDPLSYEGGITNAERTVYRTTDPNADLLHFPPGRVYHLYHGLGQIPASVQPYISFVKRVTEDGSGTDLLEPNHMTPASGNAVVIEGLWNDEYIRVRNDTCADFYLYVVALAPGAPSSSGGGEAGASN